MKRSEINHLPEYFDRYINKCDDVNIIDAIQTSIDELDNIPIEKWRALGNKTYAEGKWNIKDIIQHLIDVERIFSFRALAIARGEQQRLPGYSENEYAETAKAGDRNIDDLVSELRASHESIKWLYKSFTDDMLKMEGLSFKGKYSVGAIGFIFPGHQRWHFEVINEKYLPLL